MWCPDHQVFVELPEEKAATEKVKETEEFDERRDDFCNEVDDCYSKKLCFVGCKCNRNRCEKTDYDCESDNVGL